MAQRCMILVHYRLRHTLPLLLHSYVYGWLRHHCIPWCIGPRVPTLSTLLGEKVRNMSYYKIKLTNPYIALEHVIVVRGIGNCKNEQTHLPLHVSWLQCSISSAGPVHTPTSPSQCRFRSLTPPSQLAEHSDQSPQSVHTIEVRKHGHNHNKLGLIYIYINIMYIT